MLDSARLKVVWANHHINQLQIGVRRFLNSEPYTIETERHPDIWKTRVRIVGHTPIPPDLILIFGSTAQILRSALDHAVSEIVNATKGGDNRTVFPIHEEAQGLEGSTPLRKIQRASTDLAKVILDEIRPTKDGNYPIWALNRLANKDKHRTLLLVQQINGFEGGPFSQPGMDMAWMRFRGAAGAHNNDSFFEMPLLKEQGKVKPVIEIRIGETEAFNGADLIPTLANLSHVVTETLNAIERAAP